MGSKIIGIEVVSNSVNAIPFDYYTLDMDGIEEIGSDGYPGGSFWIRYEDGTTHFYMPHAVRRVIRK